MHPEDQTNARKSPEFDDSAMAQTTEFRKGSDSFSGVSDMFGLKGSRDDTASKSDTAKPASPTSGFTSSGLAPTALYVPLPDDATPRTLQGRYRLVAELGMGGMGVTYRAWDSRDGVPVVIKMPRSNVRANPEIIDRFNREVRTMLELSHEHIVPITDHGEEEGCPFVAMRFLPGGSLSEYRGKDEAGKAATLSPATLHFWLPGIARALDFMHSSGVLHRDVKPGNIFLDGFLKPFLGDFGIAKVVDDSGGLNREYTLTATRMAVGTPEYMAPELFRPATTPGGRVDQYALAVTVYEMLAGRKPFRGDSAHIIVEHASKDVPPLQEFCPDAPASLVEAVHKALAKNPDERFATCSEFAAAVLAEAPKLNIDTSLARLLCPRCRAILRVSETTAGKRGTCPKCKTPMAVAQDLGSLWLSGEDRSIASLERNYLVESERPFSEPVDAQISHNESRDRSIPSVSRGVFVVTVVLAACCGLFTRPIFDSVFSYFTNSMMFTQRHTEPPLAASVAASTQNQLLDEKGDRQREDQSIENLALRRRLDEAQASLAAALAHLDTANTEIQGLKQQQSGGSPNALAPRLEELQRLKKAVSVQEYRIAALTKQRDMLLAEKRAFAMSRVMQEGAADITALSKDVTNSLGMQLRLCVPGVLTTAINDVSLPDEFYIGTHEVTVRDWTRVMGGKPSFQQPLSEQGENLPVERVTWQEATLFCQRLSERAEEFVEGRAYRLPTEAEWEYACRAGSTSTWSFGDDQSELGEYCWFQDNAKTSQPVCMKKPNAWGLFDMHGNVWEWCSDWYQPTFPSVQSNQIAALSGPMIGTQKVLRGGSWGDPARSCRSSVRYSFDPVNRRAMPIGFRVAMDMVPAPLTQVRRGRVDSVESSNP